MPTPLSTLARFILAGAGLTLGCFILTGLFDYIYIRQVVGSFTRGLEAIEISNPHLAKLIAALGGAALSALFLRYGAVSVGPMRRVVGYFTISTLLVAALGHALSAYGTWGDWFDDAGRSQLKYEITAENAVVFYAQRRVSPRTNRELRPVTAEVVHELERRRQGTFHEVCNPKPDDWFAPGDGSPLLWYAEGETLHFFNMPGHDGSTGDLLVPVTRALHSRYYAGLRLEEKRAAALRAASEAPAAKRAAAEQRAADQRDQVTVRPPQVPARGGERPEAAVQPADPGAPIHLRVERPAFAVPATPPTVSNIRALDLRPGATLNVFARGRACRCWSDGLMEIAADGGSWRRQAPGSALRFLSSRTIRARPLTVGATRLFVQPL